MLSFFNQCIIFGQSTAFLESLKSLKSLNEVNRELFVAQKYVSEFYNISDINIPHFIKIINLYYTNKAGVFEGLNDSVKDCMVICINDRFKLSKNSFAEIFLENSPEPYIKRLNDFCISLQDLSMEKSSFNQFFKSISEKADYERVTNGTQFKKFLYRVYHDCTVMKTRECFINYIESLIVVNNDFKYDDSNFLVSSIKGYCNYISKEIEVCKRLLIEQSKVGQGAQVKISSLNKDLLKSQAQLKRLNYIAADLYQKVDLSNMNTIDFNKNFITFDIPNELKPNFMGELIKYNCGIENNKLQGCSRFKLNKLLIKPKSCLFKIIN